MKTELDTQIREAFEQYDKAISCIDTYRASGDREFVEKSYVHLDAAQAADPRWLKPGYLKSLVKDLAGDPQAAINELEQLKDISDSSFALEVKLNLGAAHYHRYSEEHLTEAEALFTEVKEGAPQSLQPLALLASAYLAQVYGMRVLLKRPDEAKDRKPTAGEWYERCRSEANQALASLERWKRSHDLEDERGESWVADEIEWAATNALGFAGNFWADYLSANEQISILQESISFFLRGLKLRPNHWATLSNLSSANLRLGHARRVLGDEKQGGKSLTEALRHIDLVLSPEVRPNNAFALYERGRILRVQGRFEDAIASLVEALKVPVNLRDVSYGTVVAEIVRAANHQTDFPGAPV